MGERSEPASTGFSPRSGESAMGTPPKAAA
jgi:hypothetical protein